MISSSSVALAVAIDGQDNFCILSDKVIMMILVVGIGRLAWFLCYFHKKCSLFIEAFNNHTYAAEPLCSAGPGPGRHVCTYTCTQRAAG